MRITLALAVPLMTVVACSSPSSPAKATPPLTPPLQPVADRFSNDIWPPVSAYNADHNQGGKASAAFTAILAVDMPSDQYGAVRDAAQALGRNTDYDKATQTTHYNDGLHLGTVNVKSAQDGTAELDVCYTYTHYWYVDINNTQHAPGASEATFTLAEKNGPWMLSGISDDHVVPGCAAVSG
jgi:hypothetical protein